MFYSKFFIWGGGTASNWGGLALLYPSGNEETTH